MSYQNPFQKPSPNRAVFFDRDGTLIYDQPYNGDPSKVRLYPGVQTGLEQLKAAGWRIIVITNQSGIGRGKITEQQYQAVNAEFVRQCGGSAVIDAVYYAPDHPNQAGPRRKPGIGMLKEAAQAFALDFSRSWTVGDKPSDVQAGQRAGTRTIHILNRPLSPDSPGEKSADLVVENVGQAIAHILHSSPAFT